MKQVDTISYKIKRLRKYYIKNKKIQYTIKRLKTF